VNTYHKIQTIFKRNSETKFKNLLEGKYSIPEFEFLKDNEWTFTEKVDGTNIRIIYSDNTDDRLCIDFKGKTDRAQIPVPLSLRLMEIFNPQINKFKDSFNNSVCFYGEGYGAKIQSGGNYSSSQDFVLFDIKIGDSWLQRDSVIDIGAKFGIDVVPIIGTGTLGDMVKIVKKGFSSTWGPFISEGIVARPKTEIKTRSGHRIITKLKHKDF